MKSYLFKCTLMIIGVLSVLTFSSCNKDEVSNDIDAKDNYYVRYVISASYPRIFSNWYANTPDGRYSKSGYQTRYWEETYGPVEKGFECFAGIENGEATVKIYVLKNEEPFTLKKTSGNKANYIIDF